MSATEAGVGPDSVRRAQWRRLEARFSGSDRRLLAPPVYRRRQWPFLVLMLVIGWFAPAVFGRDPYHIGLLDNSLDYAILALGFYWCFCLAGQFTFAAVAMYATGSYVSVWVAEHAGGFWVGLLAAMVVSGILGALIRVLFFKLSTLYFAIATFGVSGLLLIVYQEWTKFTGGYNGISKIAKPDFFGIHLSSLHDQYFVMLGVLGVFIAATIALERSPAMRDLTFARDNGPVAATAGLKPQYLILVAFAVGSAMQGAAGSLYAHSTTYFSLESFTTPNPNISLSVLLMVLLGGIDSVYGPVIGAVIVVYLPAILRSWQNYSNLMFAGLIFLIIIVFPGGVAGIRDLAGGWTRRARSH